MKFIIRGRKVEVTPAIKQYITDKIGRLDKYFNDPEELTATVLIKIKEIDQIVEVTIPAKKLILRAEDTNKDLYAAIDLVVDKLERQIRKNKTRLAKKKNKEASIDFNLKYEINEEEKQESKIVRHKEVEMKPMSEEEAIMQMELLGHEFFVYKDMKSECVCIIYKRKDGNYGIIETK
ncbi:MAG: ribosome-associated translation inhibitor RaiA [Bacilli bacterium]|nr:ribosome-associated translation inhibitor RaiA [Bacilli bacterium]